MGKLELEPSTTVDKSALTELENPPQGNSGKPGVYSNLTGALTTRDLLLSFPNLGINQELQHVLISHSTQRQE